MEEVWVMMGGGGGGYGNGLVREDQCLVMARVYDNIACGPVKLIVSVIIVEIIKLYTKILDRKQNTHKQLFNMNII